MDGFLAAVGRLSFLLSQGRHVCDVAIMYTVAPAEAGMGGKKAVDTAFEAGRTLYAEGIDFDFIEFESVLRAGIEDGALSVSGERYRVLVLPAMSAIRLAALEKAAAFTSAGGTVIAVGGLPEASERAGRNDPVLDRLVFNLFGVGARQAASLEQPHIKAGEKGGLPAVFRRLAIVDLSTTASQPMTNEDGTVQVVFNGEIYNHLALRKELLEKGHRFKTDHSDTEVIVHGYEEWGEAVVERLAGMFAIGNWDAARRRLFLARDRVGIKPLYFSWTRHGFLFASEIKALLAHPDVEADVEPRSVYHYLSFLTTPAPLTMFRGIFKMPAGCRAFVKPDGSMKAEVYWDGRRGGSAPGAEGRNMDHLCLRIEPFDPGALTAHLIRHGVVPGEIKPRFGADGTGPSLYLSDPEGNTVELKGPPEPRPAA